MVRLGNKSSQAVAGEQSYQRRSERHPASQTLYAAFWGGLNLISLLRGIIEGVGRGESWPMLPPPMTGLESGV